MQQKQEEHTKEYKNLEALSSHKEETLKNENKAIEDQKKKKEEEIKALKEKHQKERDGYLDWDVIKVKKCTIS